MEYIYPAIFEHNADGTYTVSFPDLPGCITEGKSIGSALDLASKALRQWIEFLESEKEEIPKPSDLASITQPGDNGFVNLVCARIRDISFVRRTISLPRWMDEAADDAGLSLSKVLQDALAAKLH